MNKKFYARWMIRRDLAECLQHAAEHGTGWTEDDFIVCLRQRNCIGNIVEVKKTDKVVGSIIYKLHNTSIEILYLCCMSVAAEKYLLDHVEVKQHCTRRGVITFDVPEDALSRHLMLKARGYRARTPTADDWRAEIYRFELRIPQEVPGSLEPPDQADVEGVGEAEYGTPPVDE